MRNTGVAIVLGTTLLPPCGGVEAEYVLQVDFENRLENSKYTEQHIIQDFNANNRDGLIHGPDWNNTWVVNDPAGTGRGNVLRIRHEAGKFEQGASFKARFAPDNENKKGSARFDDIYLAYDIYLSPNTERMPYHKLPGLGTGTLLEMSHKFRYTDPRSHSEPEGVVSFSARMQTFNSMPFPSRSSGALAVNYYDAVQTQKNEFLDTADPTREDTKSSYVLPIGEWVTIIQRVKLNTADSDDAYTPSQDLKDGLVEVWIDGEKMLSKKHLWRWTNTMKADGFWFMDFYNHRPDLISPPSEDQFVYYDNIRVSTDLETLL